MKDINIPITKEDIQQQAESRKDEHDKELEDVHKKFTGVNNTVACKD